MKKLFTFVFFITFASMNLFSQEDSSWVYGKIIESIEFEGLSNIKKGDLDKEIEDFLGKEFSDELFLDLQTMLYDLEYFEVIVPNAKKGINDGVILIFKIKESPSISKIDFFGNDSIRNLTLTGKLNIKSKDIYSDFKVEKAKSIILDEYRDKGYSNVNIEIELENKPEDNTVKISFIIDEGEQTLIKDILFKGNDVFATESKLRSIMDTKKKSLINPGVYKEEIIENDILKLEAYYHNNGYVNAKVINIEEEITPDEKKENLKHLTLTIIIYEGEKYAYNGLEVQGNEIFSNEEILKLDTQIIGNIYNKGMHERDFKNIRDLYYNNGYIENAFDNQVSIDEDKKTISHKIIIIERPLARIGKISVSGNEKTKDIVILREVPLKEGDIYNNEKVVEAYRNLMHTSLFKNVKPTPRKNESGDMDLEFVVEEQMTFNLMGGISVSGSDFEPALSFSAKEMNFLGMGRTFGGSLDLGLKTQSFSIEYMEPRILNSNYSGGGALSFEHSAENTLQLNPASTTDKEFPIGWDSYEAYTTSLQNGISISNTEPFIDKYDLSLSVYGGHSWYNSWGIVRASTSYRTGMKTFYRRSDFTPFSQAYRTGEGKWIYDDRIILKGQVFNTDSPVATTEGYAVTQSIAYGGILPFERTSDYIKSITSGDLYFKFLDKPINEEWDLILSLRLHAAYTRVFNKPGMELPEEDKTANIDGLFVARGWAPIRYGIALLDLKAEINMPIVPNIVGASLFFDSANLWLDENTTGNFNIDDFKFSFGASIGIINQMMPISFYLARTFKTENGNIVWNPSSNSNSNNFIWNELKWGISFNLNQYLQ